MGITLSPRGTGEAPKPPPAPGPMQAAASRLGRLFIEGQGGDHRGRFDWLVPSGAGLLARETLLAHSSAYEWRPPRDPTRSQRFRADHDLIFGPVGTGP